MIRIPNVDALSNEYYENAKQHFINAIEDINNLATADKNKYDDLLDYLYGGTNQIIDKNLRALICGKRDELCKIVKLLGPKKTKRKSRALPNGLNYKELTKAYDDFSKTDFCKKWALKMGITTCPYCNRIFITTLEKKSVRPELDHYYPKSVYPYLCLSMYNLVPSCKVCNTAKGTYDTKKKAFLYPFEEEFGKNAVFKLQQNKKLLDIFEDKYKVVVSIKTTDKDFSKKVKANDRELNLSLLYDCHHSYINKLIKLKRLFTKINMRSYFNTFPELFSDFSEFRNTLFLTSLEKEKWGEAPLSKLTSDILDFLEQNKSAFGDSF